jgi:hypothetical protein
MKLKKQPLVTLKFITKMKLNCTEGLLCMSDVVLYNPMTISIWRATILEQLNNIRNYRLLQYTSAHLEINWGLKPASKNIMMII